MNKTPFCDKNNEDINSHLNVEVNCSNSYLALQCCLFPSKLGYSFLHVGISSAYLNVIYLVSISAYHVMRPMLKELQGT